VIDQCERHDVPIVVVVDGATDCTELVARRVLAEHGNQRAVLIVQDNRGLSAARNRGLAETATEYVAFLDSDDLWSGDFLDQVVPALRRYRPDILEFNSALIAEDGEPLGDLQITTAGHEAERVGKAGFMDLFRCYAWARVTRTALVRRHPFPEGERFEDAGAVPWHYWDAVEIVGIGQPLIQYRQHASSILAMPRPGDIADLASTVCKAAAQYAATGDEFWRTVAGRTHQVACGRILFQPVATWFGAVRILDAAVSGMPPKRGFLRWLQIRHTLVYLLLLFAKRRLPSLCHCIGIVRR
jgi:hypothetical protein